MSLSNFDCCKKMHLNFFHISHQNYQQSTKHLKILIFYKIVNQLKIFLFKKNIKLCMVFRQVKRYSILVESQIHHRWVSENPPKGLISSHLKELHEVHKVHKFQEVHLRKQHQRESNCRNILAPRGLKCIVLMEFQTNLYLLDF